MGVVSLVPSRKDCTIWQSDSTRSCLGGHTMRPGGDFFMKWTTKKTLVLAFGTWLLLYGTAGAVDCSDDPPTLVLGRPVTNPEPVDRQDIMDLIHSYSWTLDDKDPQGFEEL